MLLINAMSEHIAPHPYFRTVLALDCIAWQIRGDNPIRIYIVNIG